jgi:hypothetical protein
LRFGVGLPFLLAAFLSDAWLMRLR